MSYLSLIRETFTNRNLAVLTVTQTLYMFTAFLWWPYRSLFILELGATKELLGMLLMLETFSQLVFQLPGGILADRLGRKKMIVLGSALRVAAPVIYLLSTHWTHIAPALIINAASMIYIPAMNALLAESLPPERRSSGFAAYRTVTWMPMIITSLLGGVFMDYFGVLQGVRLCLLASLVISAASTTLRWRYIEETLDTTRGGEAPRASERSGRRNLIQGLGSMPRSVWVLTVVAALSGFAMRMVWSFMVIYAVEIIGLTKTQWGLIGTVVSIISTLITLPSGMLADRLGRKPIIAVSKVLGPLSTIGFILASDFLQLGMVRSMMGVARGFGGTVWGLMGGPVWQALVADCTPPEERGRMMGLMGSIAGIVSTPASWVGGYMYDNISPNLPFQMSFALDTASLAIFLIFFREPKRDAAPPPKDAGGPEDP
ncbi:MAG: MFS transporter [Candidatus Bathyarchaeota archaeon]|nr:MAG: MFS transporter [Candidatus Bathyarchaeota archaeon]